MSFPDAHIMPRYAYHRAYHCMICAYHCMICAYHRAYRCISYWKHRTLTCAYHTENTEHWPITQNSNRANIASRLIGSIFTGEDRSSDWTGFVHASLGLAGYGAHIALCSSTGTQLQVFADHRNLNRAFHSLSLPFELRYAVKPQFHYVPVSLVPQTTSKAIATHPEWPRPCFQCKPLNSCSLVPCSLL